MKSQGRLNRQSEKRKKEKKERKMATSNMACAASGILLPTSLASNTTSSRSKNVAFPLKHGNGRLRRLVTCAAEEADPSHPTATTTTVPSEAEARAAKPPPIGPKRGTKVLFFYANLLKLWTF